MHTFSLLFSSTTHHTLRVMLILNLMIFQSSVSESTIFIHSIVNESHRHDSQGRHPATELHRNLWQAQLSFHGHVLRAHRSTVNKENETFEKNAQYHNTSTRRKHKISTYRHHTQVLVSQLVAVNDHSSGIIKKLGANRATSTGGRKVFLLDNGVEILSLFIPVTAATFLNNLHAIDMCMVGMGLRTEYRILDELTEIEGPNTLIGIPPVLIDRESFRSVEKVIVHGDSPVLVNHIRRRRKVGHVIRPTGFPGRFVVCIPKWRGNWRSCFA